MTGKRGEREFAPTTPQLLKHPLAFVALVPNEATLFAAGVIAGAAAKSVTAPLDRIKLLMQKLWKGLSSANLELDEAKVKQFKDAIENNYWFEFFMGFVGELHPDRSSDNNKHVLYTRKNIIVQYNKDQIIHVAECLFLRF